MKKFRLWFLILFLICGFYNISVATTFSVLPFEDAIGEYGRDSGRVAADMMISGLKEIKTISIVERSDISKILKEQEFSFTGAIDAKTAIQVGKIIGAQYLVLGKVTEVEKLSGIDPRYKKFCACVGCLTFGILGAILPVIFPSKGYRVGLNIRIVDTETGNIIFSRSVIDENDTIHEAIQDCVKKLVKEIKKEFAEN